MKPTNLPRRSFLIANVAATAAVLLTKAPAAISASAELQESDPSAQALGYRANASTVDKAKFPNYAAGQTCGSCAMYQGQGDAATGGCPLFAAKTVAKAGWCSAYAKRG